MSRTYAGVAAYDGIRGWQAPFPATFGAEMSFPATPPVGVAAYDGISGWQASFPATLAPAAPFPATLPVGVAAYDGIRGWQASFPATHSDVIVVPVRSRKRRTYDGLHDRARHRHP